MESHDIKILGWFVYPVHECWRGDAGISCVAQSFDVILATPFSSRINRVGDQLQAILIHQTALGSQMVFPSGTLLKGRVADVQASTAKRTAAIRIRFSDINGLRYWQAEPDTSDGWLRQPDENSPIWLVSAERSTRLLNMALQRRLGTNRAVWAQRLGIYENIIPDPTTDEFIDAYHRNDVLAGAGDRLRLKLVCP
jgi:hypothetical protein